MKNIFFNDIFLKNVVQSWKKKNQIFLNILRNNCQITRSRYPPSHPVGDLYGRLAEQSEFLNNETLIGIKFTHYFFRRRRRLRLEWMCVSSHPWETWTSLWILALPWCHTVGLNADFSFNLFWKGNLVVAQTFPQPLCNIIRLPHQWAVLIC